VKLRYGLSVILAAICVLGGAARAQYVEDSINVGCRYVYSLAYNSREDVVYGASGDDVFFAVSCDSNKVIESFTMPGACDVAYDSSDNKTYCTQFCESLAVVDGATHTRIKSLPMDGATILVWDRVSDRLYVSCQTRNRVAVVDCTSDSLLTYITVGACPIKLYLNSPGRRLYVLNDDANTVSIVDLSTNLVVKTLAVSGGVDAGCYCHSVDKFYLGSFRQCVVIGGQSDTIVARIALSGNVAVVSATASEEDGLVFLGTFFGGDDSVTTVSAQRDSVLSTIAVGREPHGLVYFDRSGLLYCATAISNEVCVLADGGSRVLTTLPVGNYPDVFAIAPCHNRLYVGHASTSYVYVLRDTLVGIAEPQSPRIGFSEGLSVTPNPFKRNAAVIWNSPAMDGEVVRFYAQDGRLVRKGRIPTGVSRWVWDGRDDSGALLPPGVYVLESGPGVRVKVVKLK
jgi:YVTN family beta-propeller protein